MNNLNNLFVDDVYEEVVLGYGKLIEEVYDSEDGDEGYCIMEYNDKFYYCGFDFGGSLGCFEKYNSLEELRKIVGLRGEL